MKEFAFIFRLNRTTNLVPTTAELTERKQWLTQMIDNDKVVDRGNTLSREAALIIKANGAIVDDLPVDNPLYISGYLIIRERDRESAVALAKTNPIFKAGGCVEVREVVKRTEG